MPIAKLIYYSVLPLFYGVGYFLVFSGLGIDKWDDSSVWYWDTWLLLFSTTAILAWYAYLHFYDKLRVVLSVAPIMLLSAVVWRYNSVP